MSERSTSELRPAPRLNEVKVLVFFLLVCVSFGDK